MRAHRKSALEASLFFSWRGGLQRNFGIVLTTCTSPFVHGIEGAVDFKPMCDAQQACGWKGIDQQHYTGMGSTSCISLTHTLRDREGICKEVPWFHGLTPSFLAN